MDAHKDAAAPAVPGLAVPDERPGAPGVGGPDVGGYNPTDDELREIVETRPMEPLDRSPAEVIRDLARLVLWEREKLTAYLTAFGRDLDHARTENLALGARAEQAEAAATAANDFRCTSCRGMPATCAAAGVKCCPECAGVLHQSHARALRAEAALAETREALAEVVEDLATARAALARVESLAEHRAGIIDDLISGRVHRCDDIEAIRARAATPPEGTAG